MKQGRGILVTGGTGALGRAVVRKFLTDGRRVHASWIEEGELEGFRRDLGQDAGKVHLHRADVSREEDVASLFEAVDQAGGLRASIHVAGGFAYASLEDTDVSTWKRMQEMNATSAFLCCRAAAVRMKKAGGGRIVNVAAMPALVRGAASMSAYSASKAAVLNLTQSLAQELVASGITVNAVVPTTIDTPANREAMPDADTSTWLPPEEIAEVIAYLAGDRARIVTGAAVSLSLG